MLCEASGPWDPNVGVDTALFTSDSFPLKLAFVFSVFYALPFPAKKHSLKKTKKQYFSFQFLSSVSLLKFPSVSFKCLFFPLLQFLLDKMKKTSLKPQN